MGFFDFLFKKKKSSHKREISPLIPRLQVEEIEEKINAEDLIKSILLWVKNSLNLSSVTLIQNLTPDYRLSLRWIDTDREDVELRDEFLWGEGLLGGIQEKKGIFIAENLKDREWNLPFFTRSIKLESFFAIPIGDGEPQSTSFILCGERIKGSKFNPVEVNIIKNVQEIIGGFIKLHNLLFIYRDELTLFRDVVNTLSCLQEQKEKGDIFSSIVALACTIHPCKYGILSVYVEEEGKFLIVGGKGEEIESIKGKTFGVEEGLAGIAIQQKTPLPDKFIYKKGYGDIISPRIILNIEEGEPVAIFPLIKKEFSEGCLILVGGDSFTERTLEIFKIFSLFAGNELQSLRINENLIMKATTDPLTGLYNKRSLLMRLQEVFADSERHNKKFAFIFVDIDHFKEINDAYGHITGDRILRIVAHRIKEVTRRSDMAARFGGEEFALILTETDEDGALKFAERMRKIIGETSVKVKEGETKLTISAGIGVYPAHGRSPEDIIKRADNALYRAKREGRNRVIISI